MIELMLICAAACRESAMFFTTSPDRWLIGAERRDDRRCAIGRIVDNLPHTIQLDNSYIAQHELTTILCNPTWHDIRDSIPSKAHYLPGWNDAVGRFQRNSNQTRQQRVDKIVAGLHLYADYFEALAEWQAEIEGIQPMIDIEVLPARELVMAEVVRG